MKHQKVCPYCGNEYRKNNLSVDHIIPKQIGGSEKFRIISCKDCNNKISKIEQKSMQTLTISWLITEMYESGFKIGSRRKRGLIPLQKEVGMGFNAPVKMYYNPKKKEKLLSILSPPLSPLNEDFVKRKSFITITPTSAFEENEDDTIALVSLTNKIILGTCAWLWGDKFSKSRHANTLRDRMWNINIDKVFEMKSSDKHLELPSKPDKDAMDNKPHHSILIGKLDNIVVGLLNLFGSYESSTVIGNIDNNFKKWLKYAGVVVISKTTENEILKMTWKDYENFKSKS